MRGQRQGRVVPALVLILLAWSMLPPSNSAPSARAADLQQPGRGQSQQAHEPPRPAVNSREAEPTSGAVNDKSTRQDEAQQRQAEALRQQQEEAERRRQEQAQQRQAEALRQQQEEAERRRQEQAQQRQAEALRQQQEEAERQRQEQAQQRQADALRQQQEEAERRRQEQAQQRQAEALRQQQEEAERRRQEQAQQRQAAQPTPTTEQPPRPTATAPRPRDERVAEQVTTPTTRPEQQVVAPEPTSRPAATATRAREERSAEPATATAAPTTRAERGILDQLLGTAPSPTARPTATAEPTSIPAAPTPQLRQQSLVPEPLVQTGSTSTPPSVASEPRPPSVTPTPPSSRQGSAAEQSLGTTAATPTARSTASPGRTPAPQTEAQRGSGCQRNGPLGWLFQPDASCGATPTAITSLAAPTTVRASQPTAVHLAATPTPTPALAQQLFGAVTSVFQSQPSASGGVTVYNYPPYSAGPYPYGSSGSLTSPSETYRSGYGSSHTYPSQVGLPPGAAPPGYAPRPQSETYVNGVWYRPSDLANLYGYGSGYVSSASVPGYGYAGIPYGPVAPRYGGPPLGPGYPSLSPSPYSDVYIDGMWYKPSDLPNLYRGSLYSASLSGYGYRRLPPRPILPTFGGYAPGPGISGYPASPYSDVYINGMWYKPSDLPNLYNAGGGYAYSGFDPGYGPAYPYSGGYPYGPVGGTPGFGGYSLAPDFFGFDGYPLGPAFNNVGGSYRPWSAPSRYAPVTGYADHGIIYGPTIYGPTTYGPTIYGSAPAFLLPPLAGLFGQPIPSWNPLQRLGIFGLSFVLPTARPELTVTSLVAPDWVIQPY